MANNWWDDQRNQDDIYMRRGDDRTRDFGSRPTDRESYRAGDRDAHRNDRDMAYGNYNRRPSQSTMRPSGDQSQYSRHEYEYDYGRDRDRGTNPWERNFANEEASFGRNFDRASSYESSRFARGENRDYGLGYGRDEREWMSARPSYVGRGPKGYRRSDERIREEVSETLERDPYIDASEIEVDVKDGVITLRGHVEDRRQKRFAEDAVESLSGVKDVRNELVIDQSLFQRAKEALFGGSTESVSAGTSRGDLVNDSSTAGATRNRNPRH